MSEDDYVEVDPANGTEPVDDDLLGPTMDIDLPAAAVYTAPEKIAAVVQAVLANPTTDPKMRGLLGVLTSGLGRRMVLDPMMSMLPPMDAPEEWDMWLEVLIGVALELGSDDHVVDVDAARRRAGFILGALFEAGA
jgi:hypothetical protein